MGALLVYPGAAIVKGLVEAIAQVNDFSYTDSLLAIAIVLLTVNLFRDLGLRRTPRER